VTTAPAGSHAGRSSRFAWEPPTARARATYAHTLAWYALLRSPTTADLDRVRAARDAYRRAARASTDPNGR